MRGDDAGAATVSASKLSDNQAQLLSIEQPPICRVQGQQHEQRWSGVVPGLVALAGAVVGCAGGLLAISFTVTFDAHHDPEGVSLGQRLSRVVLAPADYFPLKHMQLDRSHPMPKEGAVSFLQYVFGLLLVIISVMVAAWSGRVLRLPRERLLAPAHRLCSTHAMAPSGWLEAVPRQRYASRLLLAALVCFLWWPSYRPGNLLDDYGRAVGAASVQLTAMAMVPIPKSSVILDLTGMPFERAIYFHRQLGRAAVLSAIVHASVVLIAWREAQPAGTSTRELLWDNVNPFCTPRAVANYYYGGNLNASGSVNPGTVTFDHPSTASAPDKVSNTVWITRALTNTIYNPLQESAAGDHWTGASPMGTLWAYGRVETASLSDYGSFTVLTAQRRHDIVSTRFAMCTVAEGLCYNVDFHSYGIKGSFGYTRTLIRNGNISNTDAGSVIETIQRASAAEWRQGCDSKAWVFGNPSVYARRNFFGVVALSAFLLLGLTSMARFRRVRYHLWYCVHVLCTVVAVTALIAHHGSGYIDVAAPYFVLILVDYVSRLVRMYRRQPIVTEATVIREAAGRAVLCSLSVQLKIDPTRTVLEAGQYFFLCCPAVSHTAWHPYTAVSLESRSEVSNANAAEMAGDDIDSVHVEFLIGADGPWSRQLINRCEHMVGQRVWCDGPFGRLSISPAIYSHVVIVCGGIGASSFWYLRILVAASVMTTFLNRDAVPPSSGVTPFFRVIDELLAIPHERCAFLFHCYSLA